MRSRRPLLLILLLPLLLGGLAVVSRDRTTFRPPLLPVVASPDTRVPVRGAKPLPVAGADEPQAASSPYRSASGCGIERWAVKTLTDPGANEVDMTPVGSTVEQLAALPAPAGPTDRVAPVETTTYAVRGTLTVAMREADHDYHLVVRGAAGATMIVEIPDPACAAGSPVAARIAQARRWLEQNVGVPGVYPAPRLAPNIPVTVTGVGFFDKLHGQTGVAPNGLELHPVLSISSP